MNRWLSERVGEAISRSKIMELGRKGVFWFTDTLTPTVIGSFTILTTTANETLRRLHNRMPVILDQKSYAGSTSNHWV